MSDEPKYPVIKKKFNLEYRREMISNNYSKFCASKGITNFDKIINKSLESSYEKYLDGTVNNHINILLQAPCRTGKSWFGIESFYKCKEMNKNIKLFIIVVPQCTKNSTADAFIEKINEFNNKKYTEEPINIINEDNCKVDGYLDKALRSNYLNILVTTPAKIYGNGSIKSPIGNSILDTCEPSEIVWFIDEIHKNTQLFSVFSKVGKALEKGRAETSSNLFELIKLNEFIRKCFIIGVSGTAKEIIYYHRMYLGNIIEIIPFDEQVKAGCIVDIHDCNQIPYSPSPHHTLEEHVSININNHFLPQFKENNLSRCVITCSNKSKCDIIENHIRSEYPEFKIKVWNSDTKEKNLENFLENGEYINILIGCRRLTDSVTIPNTVCTIQTSAMSDAASSANPQRHRSDNSFQLMFRSCNPELSNIKRKAIFFCKNEKEIDMYKEETKYLLDKYKKYERFSNIYNSIMKSYDRERQILILYFLARIQIFCLDPSPKSREKYGLQVFGAKMKFEPTERDINLIQQYIFDEKDNLLEDCIEMYKKYHDKLVELYKDEIMKYLGIEINATGKWVYLNKEFSTGYMDSNPEKKEVINSTIVNNINPNLPGKIIVLDHDNFRTSQAIIEKYPELKDRLVIVQYKKDIYEKMKEHPLFGKYVINNSLGNFLEQDNGLYNAIYADGCQELSTIKKEQWLENTVTKLQSNSILAITIIQGLNEEDSNFDKECWQYWSRLLTPHYSFIPIYILQENSQDLVLYYGGEKGKRRVATMILQKK